jgi:cell division septation protein DedD
MAPPQPRANPRVASRPAPPPEPAANAPLSLSPTDASPQPAPIVNNPPPRAAAPPPARVANAPAAVTGGTGGFLVQVSSQRSEADAENAFRSIQSRYTGVLGGQRHTVKRADLGSKGVYYRAMVGPFGTRDQAIQLCSSLKAAGGDCVVQAN